MFDGIEVDMLDLGDADCILVTQWTPSGPQRVLIDGGAGDDAQNVRDFLRSRNSIRLWAVVCTHLHGDHASGLIKVVQDKSITIHNAWMHDIRNHVSADALRRASAGNSSQAEGVRQVVETTKELAAAFASRKLTPQEPFAGAAIAAYPSMTVLGPSLPFYWSVLKEFTKVELPAPTPPALWTAMAALGGQRPRAPQSPGFARIAPLSSVPRYPSLSMLLPPPPSRSSPNLPPLLAPITGALGKSSVKETPTTQPFNNTSVILGVLFNGKRLLFTADAGSDALARVSAEWNHLLWMQVPHHGSDGNLSQRDIERFCPQFANISACGDTSHPSRAIVSGLVKVGAQVFSTHQSGNLWFYSGSVPYRADYSSAVPLKGTGEPKPVDWTRLLSGINR